jgi:hypothetical protein
MTFGLRTIIQRVKKFFRREKSADENSETNEWRRGIFANQCLHAIKEQIVAWMTLGEPIHINMECCLPVAARQAQ